MKNQTSQIYHVNVNVSVNVWNVAYLISNLASHFKCVKRIQNVSPKNSKA